METYDELYDFIADGKETLDKLTLIQLNIQQGLLSARDKKIARIVVKEITRAMMEVATF
jgi:hypothetical protein